MLKICFESERIRHEHEDSKVDYSVGECCFDRLKETSVDRQARCKHQRGPTAAYGSILHRASLRFTSGQYELEILG